MSRVYFIEHKQAKGVRLVRAANRAQALRHVAEREFVIEVASHDSLIDHVGKGVKVEDAAVTEPTTEGAA